MKAEDIYKVLDKLIGNINPVADSSVDRVRSENLDVFIDVFDKMDTTLKDISWDNRNSPFGSVQGIVKKIDKYYEKINDTDEDKKQELQLDRNSKLISDFMELVKQEANIIIPDSIFEKFFNA